MRHHIGSLALLAAVSLAACAKQDSPEAKPESVDGATTNISPSTAGTPVDTGISANSGAAANAGTTSTTGAMLDPNSATKEQLLAVPGMTTSAADALIAGRPYNDMVAADKALAGAGLSADARKQAYAQLWKPIDLNKASKAEMLLIPGVGARMSHEFEEYRPYKDLAQFDREIGKYVDKAEVARLRRYVRL